MSGPNDENCCDFWPHDEDAACRWNPLLDYSDGVGLNLRDDYEDLIDDAFWEESQ